MFIVISFIVFIVVYAIFRTNPRAAGDKLGKKFELLGELRGKSLADITSVAGDPISTANMGNGKTLYQWAAPSFRIALLFEGGKCIGISSVYGGVVS